MNYYTAIWEKRWQSGSHHHCLTKKTIFKAKSPHQIMNSEYGDAIVYLFEGVVLTLGETFKEEDVKELDVNTSCQRCCANCRFSFNYEDRYDQVYCMNSESIHGDGNVEATDCCEFFEESKKY